MSSNYSSNRNRSGSSSRRRSPDSNRSGASSDHGQSSYRGAERNRQHSISRPALKKQGFFAKLLSLIGLGSQKSTPAKPLRAPRADRPEGSAPRPSRRPTHIEVTTPRVYVGNLSFDATESDLQELFSGVGAVQNVEIVANRETHRSKGFGFVQLSTVEEAKRAVSELHDKEYMGRKMVVSGAKAVAESRSERSERRESSEGASEASATNTAAA
jgi:hypothetical protein